MKAFHATLVCVLPYTAGWSGPSTARLSSTRAASAMMRLGNVQPVVIPPPAPSPEPELTGLDLVKSFFDDVSTNTLSADIDFSLPSFDASFLAVIPAVAILAIGANTIREAMAPSDEVKFGPGFADPEGWTPAMKEAYAYRTEKESFKYKFIEPVKAKIENVVEGQKEAFETSKKVAAAKKEQERKAKERDEAIALGKLIEVPGPLSGLVVPNPLAVASDAASLAGEKAKELLPSEVPNPLEKAKELLPIRGE